MKNTKYILVLFAAIMFAITSCGNRGANNNNNSGETHTHADGTVHAGPAHDNGGETHTHADGTVHAGPAHDHGTPNTNEQETFDADSTKHNHEGHNHEEGHNHDEGHKH